MKLSWIKLQIKDKIPVLSLSRKIMKEKKNDDSPTR
jgi:hypothetical protein